MYYREYSVTKYAKGGATSKKGGKFGVNDMVMVNDSKYTKLFTGFDLTKPAKVIDVHKVKTSKGTFYTYGLEFEGGIKPYNYAMENQLSLFQNGIMAKGGKTNDEEGVDLFEDNGKNMPKNVLKILDKYGDAFEAGDYEGLRKARQEIEKIGYTFEFYLDGQAYDLRKIGQKGKSEFYAKGGLTSNISFTIRDENDRVVDSYLSPNELIDWAKIYSKDLNENVVITNTKEAIKYIEKHHFEVYTYEKAGKFAKGGMMSKGGMVVTSIKDIPNFKEELEAGNITYRGLGLGKIYKDFYNLAGTNGFQIKVKNKHYFITDKEFDTVYRDKNTGKRLINFDAPYRKG